MNFALLIVFSLIIVTKSFLFSTIAPPLNPSCVYFSGAGIYFWWQMGVAKYMKENCQPELFKDIPIIGASAGSITASLLITGADFDSIPSSAVAIAEEWDIYNRKLGLAGVWGTMLRQWLDMVLPKDVEEDSLRNLHIALTPTLKPSKLVSGIIERSDLIDAIMASCHVPVFLDGRPFTEYKGEQVVDGSFWYFVTKNRFSGLPMLDGTSRDGIYWVDYVDDEDFLQSISGNFLELIKPDDMYNMIEAGYNFMKREHSKGRLPMPKRSLSYSRSSLLSSRTLRSIPTTIGYNLASSLYSIAPMMTSGRIIRT